MKGTVSYDLLISKLTGGDIGFTEEGGLFITFVNNAGFSQKGTVVTISPVIDNAVDIAPALCRTPVGVIYESDVVNGSLVKVVVFGKAQVLLKDGQAAKRGHWVGVSDTAGRMYQSSLPPTISHLYQGLGRSLENRAGGRDVLSYVFLNLL